MSGLESSFDALAAQWEAHCAAHAEASNPHVFVRHPSFESIVALGPAAVPLIVQRYRTGSLFWGAALGRITGLTEHGDGLTGNLEATRGRWLSWWESQVRPGQEGC